MLIRSIQMRRLNVKLRGNHLKMLFAGQDTFVIGDQDTFVIGSRGFSTIIAALGSMPYCLVRGPVC